MKKIKMRLVLILFAAFCNVSISAQNTGVLGKKFILKGGLNLGVNYDDYTTYDSPKDWVRTSPSFGIEYVTGRKVSFAFNFMSFKRNMYWNGTRPIQFMGYYEYERAYSLKGNMLSLDFKKYIGDENSYIAPIGIYWGFMLSVVNSKVIDDSGYIDKGNDIVNHQFFMPGFQVGKHNVYFDRLVWDFSVQTSWRLAMPPGRDSGNWDELKDYDQVKIASEQQTRRAVVFNLRMGLGVLLF